MPEDAQPQDIAAELVRMIGDPSANGGETPDTQATTPDATEGDELPEFAVQPTDPPDFVERMKKARQTVTAKTTAIAREREKLQEQMRQAEADRRDAELFRTLKTAHDPSAVISAMVGPKNQNGGFDSTAVLARAKERFDEPTYQGIVDIAKAIWRQEAAENLTPYQQAIQTLVNDRGQNEWRQVTSEFGDDAGKWKDKALQIQQQTGLNLSDALLVASQGQIALSKVRAQVLDARKRAATPASVPEGTVTSKKIGLTREQRTELIRKAAAAQGIEQFMH